MRIRRLLLRILFFLLIGVPLLALTAAVVAYYALQEDLGRQELASLLSETLSTPEQTVVIEGIGPGLPARLSVERISVADAAGPYLQVRDVVFEWRPLSLSRGVLHVEKVTAGEIDLSRLPPPSSPPEPAEPAAPLDLRPPRLPVAVRIDQLALPVIRLPAALAGTPATLNFTGRLAAEQEGFARTDLALGRVGESPLLTVEAAFDRARDALALDLRLAEAADGLLVTLANVAGRPAVSLRLSGDGPLADWRGTLAAEADGLARLDADLAAALADQSRLGLQGKARIDPALLPPLRPLLGEELRFDLAVLRPNAQTVTIEHARIDGQGLALTAAGHVDLDAAKLDAAADLTLQRAALAADLLGPASFATATLALKAKGAIERPVLDVDARADEITAPGVALGEVQIVARAGPAPAEGDAPPGIDLDAQLRTQALRSATPLLQALAGATPAASLRASVDGAFEQVRLQALAVDGAHVALRGTGDYALAEDRLQASLGIRVPELRPVGAAAALPSASGSVQADVAVEGRPQQGALTARLQANGSNLATGIAAVDALLGGMLTARAEAALAPSGDASIDGLQLAGRHVSVEGVAWHSADGVLDARASVRLPSLAPLSRVAGTPLRGSADLLLTARGATADPQAQATLSVRDIAADSITVPAGQLTVDARKLVSAPEGRLVLDAATSLGPVAGTADFAMQPGNRLRVSPLQFSAAELRLAGDVEAALDGPLLTGLLHLRATDGPVAQRLLPLMGPFAVDLRLLPMNKRQSVSADLRAGPLTLVGEPGVAAARIDSVTLNAEVNDALGAPRGRFTLRGERAVVAGIVVEQVGVDGEGAPDRATLMLTGRGLGPSPDRLDASADVSLAGGTIEVLLRRLEGRFAGHPVHLQRPARLSQAGARLSLDDLALALGEGTLTARVRLAPGTTQADLHAEAVPLDLARRFVPPPARSGKLDARVLLGSEGGPRPPAETAGEVELHITGLALHSAVASPGSVPLSNRNGRRGGPTPAELLARVRLGSGEASGDASINMGDAFSATAEGRLPLRLPAGSLTPVIDERATCVGEARVAGDVEKLALLLGLPDQRLAGRIDGQARVSGTLQAPDAEGELTLSRGLYENFTTGTLLRDVGLRAVVTRERTLSLTFDASDGNSGRLKGEGGARLLEAGYEATMHVESRGATLVRRDDVTATIDANLDITAHPEGARVTGRIEPTEVDVSLASKLPPSVAILPVIEIGVPRQPGPQQDSAAGGDPFVAALDLAVLPRRVFVRGRGLESEWMGDLAVTGTTAKPRVAGTVRLVRGVFTFANKRFDLQQGVIGFDGGERVDPQLNIVAELRTSDITALITVTGFASEPRIALSSQPPLPESEILAQVLFGKSSARLTPVEAVQLAAAADTLARGESMSEDAFSAARTLLGLDTLSLQPGQNENQAGNVAVGRYIGSGVYVGAQQGVGDDTSRSGTVEVEILPGLSLESGLGQQQQTGTTEGSVGLKWRYDY